MARRPKNYDVYREPVVQPQDQSIKIIALTKGQKTLVDASDYEKAMTRNWGACWDPHTQKFYAKLGHSRLRLHRFLLDVTDPKIQIDHINGDTLDNRRCNLRVTNQEGNRQNRGAYKNNKSGRAGVYWHKRDEVWVVFINANGKRTYCGEYKDKEKAIERRIAAELEHHGEFAFSLRHAISQTIQH